MNKPFASYGALVMLQKINITISVKASERCPSARIPGPQPYSVSQPLEASRPLGGEGLSYSPLSITMLCEQPSLLTFGNHQSMKVRRWCKNDNLLTMAVELVEVRLRDAERRKGASALQSPRHGVSMSGRGSLGHAIRQRWREVRMQLRA